MDERREEEDREQEAAIVFRWLTELASDGIVTIRGKGGALEVVSRSMRF